MTRGRAAPALLLLPPLLLPACGLFGDDDDSAGPPGDDDADDDDDATTPPPAGTCSLLGAPGVEGEVPCDPALGGDVFQLLVPAGAAVLVTVDTVAAASTFDPRFRGTDVLGTFLFAGDDDCDCAFPPGDGYGCAEQGWTAEGAENLRVHVASFLTEVCASGASGSYVLRVAVDGEPAAPVLVSDDGPTVFGG